MTQDINLYLRRQSALASPALQRRLAPALSARRRRGLGMEILSSAAFGEKWEGVRNKRRTIWIYNPFDGDDVHERDAGEA